MNVPFYLIFAAFIGMAEKNVAKKLEDFHGDCHVRVWLCQIAKNTYYNYAKKKSGFVELKEVFRCGYSENYLFLTSESCWVNPTAGRE